RRERGDGPRAVWVYVEVAPAGHGRVDVVLLVRHMTRGRALAPIRPRDQWAVRPEDRIGRVRELLLLVLPLHVVGHAPLGAEGRSAVGRGAGEHAPVVVLEVDPRREHAPSPRGDARGPGVAELGGEIGRPPT